MAPRKSTTTRDGHSKAIRSIRKQARFQRALARQPVQVSSMSTRSDPDSREQSAPGEVPSRLPMRRLPPLGFSKNSATSAGRKLSLPVKVTAAGATERSKPIKAGGSLQKAVLQNRVYPPDPVYPSSEGSSQDLGDSSFVIKDCDMDLDLPVPSPKLATPSNGSIFRDRARKDYKEFSRPCFQCGGVRNSRMVNTRSGRCQTCLEAMRYKRYTKKRTALGLTPVDRTMYFLAGMPSCHQVVLD
jgi:hypothetical protein